MAFVLLVSYIFSQHAYSVASEKPIAKEIIMNRTIILITTSILYLYAAGIVSAQQTQQSQQTRPAMPPGHPPIAGRAPLGVTVIEMEAIVLGWSAKRDLLGKTVYNDKNAKIGTIDDIILTPSSDVNVPFASFAIIGVGGFLGLGKNDVAIPMPQLKLQSGKLVLPGATKDGLKALPKFEYAPRK